MISPHPTLRRHLTRPTRGGAAGVLIIFAFLFSIAAKGGLLGIPLAFLLTSWFFKYAYILFDHTVSGYDEPPTLDIQMLNPLTENRPLAQVVILCLIYAAVKFTRQVAGPTVALILGAAAILLLPASIAILGLERNLFKAANPVEWIRMVIALGPMYALVLAIIAGYSLLIALLERWAPWLPLQFALILFALLSLFSILGGALYERRHQLGLETSVSPERTQALQQTKELHQSERLVTEAYGKARAGSHIEAWQLLQSWLTTRGHDPDDYRWLCSRAETWDDPRYITRLTEDHIERLLTLKRTGEALDVVAQRLTHDPTFRPNTAAATLQLAQLAAAGGAKPRVARILLTDFPTRFPTDPQLPAATSLARQLDI
jgi:hypothetical protein